MWNTTRRYATGIASQPRSAGAARSAIVPSAPDWEGPGDGSDGGFAVGAAGLAQAAARTVTAIKDRSGLKVIVPSALIDRSALVLRAVTPGRHRPTTAGQDRR